MKKSIIIIIAIIIVGAILSGIWWFDNTKIMEPITNYSSTSKLAYSLNESNTEVSFTIYYFTKELVKTVTIYQFDTNNKVKNIISKRHYETKLQAKSYFNRDEEEMDTGSSKVKDNVIIGTINTKATDNIMKDKTDLLNELNKYKDIWIEIK